MTEFDWDTATDPAAMLTLAAPRVSDRKLRLYLVGCCRRRWELFTDPRCREAVEVAERFADGRANDTERGHALVTAREAYEQTQWPPRGPEVDVPREAAGIAWGVCDSTADLRSVQRAGRNPGGSPVAWAARVPVQLAVTQARVSTQAVGGSPERAEVARESELAAQADLLRCVFGNPFVYTVPEPRWLTSDVIGLAKAIYAGRGFERLPILADALEEAGCDDPAVLDHCRRHRDHARGCWVIDLLLDKA